MSAHGCQECRERDRVRGGLNRRLFLRAGGLSVVSFGFAPGFLGRALGATAPADGRGKVLVCVFLRGAVDGLNMVVPHGERAYYDARPRIAVPGPGRGDGRALDLDGFFGLHPALSDLHPYFTEGSLAAVHAIGSPDPTRSHFDAQDYMETGTPGVKSTRDGWLNRALRATAGDPDGAASLTRGLALTEQLPRSFAGSTPALALGDLERFLGDAMAPQSGGRAAGPRARALEEGFRALYGNDGRDLLLDSGSDALDAKAFLRAAEPLRQTPAAGAAYPNSDLGRQLRQVAQLIKADVGLEIAFTDVGGWDTHVNQGAVQGQLANRLRDLGRSLAAFARDLGSRLDDVAVLTMSEFGRTVEENGSAGTDHGHANVSLVLGGGARGGRVYGEWPGLDREQRYQGRDLEVTTDFRDLFSEVLQGHLKPRTMDGVFPGHVLDRRRDLGLFA